MVYYGAANRKELLVGLFELRAYTLPNTDFILQDRTSNHRK